MDSLVIKSADLDVRNINPRVRYEDRDLRLGISVQWRAGQHLNQAEHFDSLNTKIFVTPAHVGHGLQ